MKTIKYKYLAIAVILGAFVSMTSCTGDLDTVPISESDVVGETVYGKDLSAYQSGLAKIYAGLAISGNRAVDDQADVAGVDAGSQASFLRGLWNLQELSSDEAHCCWIGNDAGVNDLNNITWNSTNPFIKGFYYRLFYQVNLANEFLRETTEGKLSSRGMDESTKATVLVYRNDARFMRALAYYYLLDMFRNVPFTTEESTVGKEAPPQILAKDLYAYIESELTEIESGLLEPFVGYDSQNYGRVTKAAAWALLSRLYLNAEIYIGEKKYTESLTYSNKVLNVGYQLEPVYVDLFKADNGSSKEMIFPVRYEGADTQTWGGMTFLICSAVPSSMKGTINAQDAWQGNRAKTSLDDLFAKISSSDKDTRYDMFYPELATNIEIIDPTSYGDGIPVVKYWNINKDGSVPASNLPFTDFPLFRLGEIYLNYAEAVVRGGSGGDTAKALSLINELRSRAYNGETGYSITSSSLTLDFLLDERGREFFFEGQRRTDLIRFGKYTGSTYIWPWKGGSSDGRSTDSKYAVFPIPIDDINSNPNLTQNEGYN